MARTAVAALALALCAGMLASPASAQLTRCVGWDAKVFFTDGPCPTWTQGDPSAKPDQAIAIPELTWERQVFAQWCVERWETEASPLARASLAHELRSQAQAGGDQVRQDLQKAGLTLEEAIAKQLQADVLGPFNTDCLYFGFKRVSAETDLHNERASRELKQVLETKYPDSKERFERSRMR